MAQRNPASFMKRMKEIKRKEKARLKRERRENKKKRGAEAEGLEMNQGPFVSGVTGDRPADVVDEPPRE